MQKKPLLLLLFVLFIFTRFTSAQWQAANGPTGGNVNTLFNFTVEGNGVVYAGSPFGLFKSTDSGVTWNPIAPALAGKSISSINSFGPNLYVGTKGYGVYTSTDSGKTFNNFNSSSKLGWINTLALAGEVLFAGGVGGVMRSNDNGNTWTKVGTLTSGKTITSITTYSDANNTFIIAGDDKGSVYTSTDFGASWVEKNPTQKLGFIERIGHHVLAPTISAPPPIWAATRSKGIAVTTDNGATWNFKNNGLPLVAVTNFAFTDANNFVVSTAGLGLFKTTDGGNNWIQISNNGLTDKFVNTLILLGLNLVAGTQSGIFQTLVNSIIWQPTNTGLLNIAVNSFLMIGNSIYAGTSGGVFLSTDFGLNWLLVGLAKTFIATLIPGPAGMILAGVLFGGLMKSTNNGNTWTRVSGGALDEFTSVTSGVYNGNNGLYVIGTETKGALKSSDLTNWTNTGGLDLQFVSDIQSDPSGTKYYAGSSGGLFESDDGGNNFVKIGFDGKNVIKVNILDSLKILASTGDSGIFQSIDGGKTWTQKWDNNAKGASVISVYVISESSWIVTTSKGTFITEDFGETYSNQDTGLILKDVKAILPIAKPNKTAFTNTTFDILGGTNGMSVWLLPNFVVTAIDDNNSSIPNNFSLSQNYPNPFNPSTVINFQLSVFSKVSLKVYDVLGREVATLVNEEKPAGNYKVNFNASNLSAGRQGLSSGVYLYRLSAVGNGINFIQTKKMILIK